MISTDTDIDGTAATGSPGQQRKSLPNLLRSLKRRIDGFFFAPDVTPWETVRVGAALVILGPLLLSGLSGNYERFYGHWGSLP
ncbi:MAG TPA: hypothetical protein VIT23_05435, partial [Terrimicrobiaceae bacterium]